MKDNMKITTKLALEYLRKNKVRTMVTIVRNNYCNYTYDSCSYTSFKFSKIYDRNS